MVETLKQNILRDL